MAFDEKMHFYSCVVEDMKSNPMDRDVEFAVLHMSPLARALQDNAQSWVTSLGKLLNESAKESLMALNLRLSVNSNFFVCVQYMFYCSRLYALYIGSVSRSDSVTRHSGGPQVSAKCDIQYQIHVSRGGDEL